MLISLNWIKDFVTIPVKTTPEELANLLTLKTAEVEQVIHEGKDLEHIVVGQILEISAHPNADKLKVTKTSVGPETLQIVCGGSNLKEGMYVAVAKVGARVKWHGQGDLVTLEKVEIRGVESNGMICAGSEIGIPDPNAEEKEILDLSSLKPKTGTRLSELFQKNDIILEFDNKALTHRPDLWGHYGIAREIAALTNSKLEPLNPSAKIPTKGESVKVEVENPLLCPRYCGLIIENIKVGPSPDWLKNRLLAVGHGTHNNIVDVTNYVMAELGQPLHAFDKNYIKKAIVVRNAKAKEKITALDNKTYELNSEMLVIADHEKPLAIAGVMGGQNSGINEKTTSIIIESANFNSSSIRKTSTKLGLRTEAVQRFEKALDPLLADLAIRRATELILQICPDAKIAGPITDIKKFNEKPLVLSLDTEKAKSKIGVEIDQKQMKTILESLEFKVETKDKKTFSVTVPSFRATKDVDIEDDLIEEIARIYGYENIAPTLPTLPTKLPTENTERFKKHRAREILAYGLGFEEVYNYSFYGKKEIESCLMSEDGHLKLLNHLSEDQTHMRASMTPNILKNLQHNVKFQDEVRIYEIGRTYREIGEFFPLEEKKIIGAILVKGKSDEPFYEAKGATETILKRFNIEKFEIAKGVKAAPYAHPTKSVTYIDHNAQTLAKIFMLHPQVAKNHDLENYSIGIFAINFTELMKMEKPERKYRPIPKFPNIEIDISVVVDRKTESKTIEDAIKTSDQSLINNVTLFDLYEGDKIEKDKKALAYKITLMSLDRTLTDEDMTKVKSQILKNLEKVGGHVRGN